MQFEFIRAVLALNYAIDHPDKVKALVLIAAQYKMPRKLLKVQNMLFHLMPNSAFKKMGFKKADFRSYFLSFDDDTRIEIMNKPEMSDCPKELTRTGYAHIAFSVGSKEKVDALTAELRADGYKVVSGPRKTGDGYYESCIVAFEDNQIEITV